MSTNLPESAPPVPGLSDSHFHSTALADRGVAPAEILRQIRRASDAPFLDVAIVPEDPPRQRELTGEVSGVYYSCGIHPSETGRHDWKSALASVSAQIEHGGFHAVGETGLDWYRMYAPRERQIELFAAQLAIASAHRLPVIVHNREADNDTLACLRAAQLTVPGVMHCYSSGPERVAAFLDAGMYISFAGNVTFRSAGALREALRLVPADRLLVETDAPFLAPSPLRGRTSHPGLVPHTLQVMAEVRNSTMEELALTTGANLSRLLQLD